MSDPRIEPVDPIAPRAERFAEVMGGVRRRRRRRNGLLGAATLAVVGTLAVGAAALGSSGSGGEDSLSLATTVPSAEPTVTPAFATEPSPSPSRSAGPTPTVTPSAPGPSRTSTPSRRVSSHPASPPALPYACHPFEGRVVDSGGHPVAGLRVGQDSGSSAGTESTTGADGTFVARAGLDLVVVESNGTDYVPRVYGPGYGRELGADGAFCADVDAGNHPVRTDIVVESGAPYTGVITLDPCLALTDERAVQFVYYQPNDKGRADGNGQQFATAITPLTAHSFRYVVHGVPLPGSHYTGYLEVAFGLQTGGDVGTGVLERPALVGGTYTSDVALGVKDVHPGLSDPSPVPSTCASPTPTPTP